MPGKEELLYAIVVYLQGLAKDDDKQRNAVAELANAFAIDTSASAFETLSHFPLTLEDLFDAGIQASLSSAYSNRLKDCSANKKFKPFVDAVAAKGYYSGAEEGSIDYLERHAKVLNKFSAKLSAKGGAEDEAAAESKKNEGNTCISNKDYQGAIKAYTEALELSPEGPNSHIYLTNRAAAHCYLKDYGSAIADCKSATKLNPTYVKAYSRLGLANFFLENYEDAIAAYSKCIELEPENAATRESLRQAQAKLEEQRGQGAPSSSSSQGAPDLSALMGGLGGMGGLPPNLDALMQNPAIAQMAQEMMKNPALMQQALAMMGGGGKPDPAAFAEMMKSMKK